MNTNTYRHHYTLAILSLRNEEDKNACLQLIVQKQNATLCQGIYDESYLKSAIEYSDYAILRRRKSMHEHIVAFALVQNLSSRKALDILLACTIPNKERYGNMIAYDAYSFAVSKKYKKIYTAPRTSDLRKTFMKYGFEHHSGIPDINEVLIKTVSAIALQKVNKTLKRPRSPRPQNPQT